MIFWTWLRSPRVTNSATKSVQAVPVKPLLGPLIGLSGTQISAPLLDQKPFQPPRDVPVDLGELVGGVAGAEPCPRVFEPLSGNDLGSGLATRPSQNNLERVALWERRRRAVGQRIRTLRIQRSLTQEALALQSGVTRNVLIDVEHGKRSLLYERLFDLAEALEVPVAELLPEDQ